MTKRGLIATAIASLLFALLGLLFIAGLLASDKPVVARVAGLGILFGTFRNYRKDLLPNYRRYKRFHPIRSYHNDTLVGIPSSIINALYPLGSAQDSLAWLRSSLGPEWDNLTPRDLLGDETGESTVLRLARTVATPERYAQ